MFVKVFLFLTNIYIVMINRVVLIVFFIVFLTSCDKCVPCKEVYSDLETANLEADKSDLVVDESFYLSGDVMNPELDDECYKESNDDDAPKTQTGFKVRYRKNENSPWEVAFFYKDDEYIQVHNEPTDEIDAGYLRNVFINTSFSSAGDYQFFQNADNYFEVKERSETNNEQNTFDDINNKKNTTFTKYIKVKGTTKAHLYNGKVVVDIKKTGVSEQRIIEY